jgi:hypothetical protein
MPKTAASIFELARNSGLKEFETNYFMSPFVARKIVYTCSFVYFVF